jgi:hypothetical protein
MERTNRCFENQIQCLTEVLVYKMRLLQGRGRNMLLYRYIMHSIDLLFLEDRILPICHRCRVQLRRLVEAMLEALTIMPPAIRISLIRVNHRHLKDLYLSSRVNDLLLGVSFILAYTPCNPDH